MKRKCLAIGIILLFAGVNVTSSLSGTIEDSNEMNQKNEKHAVPFSTMDWWPMFHHDLSHSGFSTSPAPSSNNVIWSFRTGNSPGITIESSPAVVDGRVYVGSNDQKVYCLTADTAAKIWEYTTGDSVMSSPAVADGKIYVGSNDHKVYCLYAKNGAKIWDYTTGDSVMSSPAVVDGRVYVGSGDQNVYCLDADTGAEIWNDTTDGLLASSPAIADGKLYISSKSNDSSSLYCLNTSNGDEIWAYPAGDDISSSPAIAYGRVYFGSHDNKIYCLDADDGDYKWSRFLGTIITSSPAVADGKIFIGDYGGDVHCFDAYNASEIWVYHLGEYIASSPAVADGKLYISSTAGYLYCFGNRPPYSGAIHGPSWGIITYNYTFHITVADLDEDHIYLKWDWGDGTNTTWLGPYTPITKIYLSHIWSQRGTYEIRVKLKDEYGLETNWSDPYFFTVYELKKAFIFGRYKNLVEEGEYITIEAVNLRLILFNPFQFLHYMDGEKVIFDDVALFVSPQFIIGIIDVGT